MQLTLALARLGKMLQIATSVSNTQSDLHAQSRDLVCAYAIVHALQMLTLFHCQSRQGRCRSLRARSKHLLSSGNLRGRLRDFGLMLEHYEVHSDSHGCDTLTNFVCSIYSLSAWR